MQKKNTKQDNNLLPIINEIDGSEYSEIENDNKINSICIDIKKNNDDHSDGEDELIFNNGNDILHYGTIKDSEVKNQLNQLASALDQSQF